MAETFGNENTKDASQLSIGWQTREHDLATRLQMMLLSHRLLVGTPLAEHVHHYCMHQARLGI